MILDLTQSFCHSWLDFYKMVGEPKWNTKQESSRFVKKRDPGQEVLERTQLETADTSEAGLEKCVE